jgi:hypothetical protein
MKGLKKSMQPNEVANISSKEDPVCRKLLYDFVLFWSLHLKTTFNNAFIKLYEGDLTTAINLLHSQFAFIKLLNL